MSDSAHNTGSAEAGSRRYGIAPPGGRLPPETRLGPIRLQVADLERSLEYYRAVLGFRPVEHEDDAATLAAHGDDRPLIMLQERTGAPPVPARGRLGLYHFAILLPARADLGRFLRHLSDVGKRAGASDHAVSEALYLRDPDGLGIEVYSDRSRSAWETNGREIRMETAPLNAREVLAAAGDTAWTGMPSGTTMGHVHLHVGDLDQAAAFYHAGLGLDKVVWSYPGALFLSAGGYHHHLGLNVWAAGAKAAGDDDAKLLEWSLELPDRKALAATEDRLRAAGYAVERDGGGGILTGDPWGTPLRVIAAATQSSGLEGH